MKTKRILFVDDGAIFREPIKAALEQEGYLVETAVNGRDALDKLKESPAPFDLFLVDVNMPEMDGFTFLGNVKEISGMSKIPAIMLTASAERDFVIKAKEFGVKEYLVKAHFSLDQLFSCVSKHLS